MFTFALILTVQASAWREAVPPENSKYLLIAVTLPDNQTACVMFTQQCHRAGVCMT
jgi:hypothetical protein